MINIKYEDKNSCSVGKLSMPIQSTKNQGIITLGAWVKHNYKVTKNAEIQDIELEYNKRVNALLKKEKCCGNCTIL